VGFLTLAAGCVRRRLSLQAGQVVAWVCDPMHGNTEEVSGYKTRRYDNVRAEVEAFFDVHDQCGSVPGGVHLEMTGGGGGEGGGALGHGRQSMDCWIWLGSASVS
jgi:3-deoxy-D-arabino-heptulosonate 7-phosphate (DAHP) synthase class II